ncbi:MAG: hypothetical protein KAI22_12065, partial [Gammaproteobacteria bacterium]|nr:hypothetical protein [Gammaproteobacteria bacterium]
MVVIPDKNTNFVNTNGMKVIALNPRETAGIAYIKKMGGLHLDVFPGSDNLVLGAIARIIMQNGW